MLTIPKKAKKPDTILTSLVIPAALHAEVRKVATHNDTSIATVIRHCISATLEQAEAA